MTLHDEILSAIQAHAMWKIRLLKVIEAGTSDLDPPTVYRDDVCAFGRWLHGGTIPDDAKAMNEYAWAILLHADFHHMTSELLATAMKGNRRKVLDSLGEGSVYYETSAALIQILKLWDAKWSRSLAGQLGPA